MTILFNTDYPEIAANEVGAFKQHLRRAREFASELEICRGLGSSQSGGRHYFVACARLRMFASRKREILEHLFHTVTDSNP